MQLHSSIKLPAMNNVLLDTDCCSLHGYTFFVLNKTSHINSNYYYDYYYFATTTFHSQDHISADQVSISRMKPLANYGRLPPNCRSFHTANLYVRWWYTAWFWRIPPCILPPSPHWRCLERHPPRPEWRKVLVGRSEERIAERAWRWFFLRRRAD